MTKRGKWVRALVVGLLLALVVGRWLAVSTADRLWAQSLGVGEPHAQIARMRFLLAALAFAVAAVWSLGNLYFVFRTIRSVHVPRTVGNIEILEVVPRRYLGAGVAIIGLIIAVFLSYGAADWWYAKALSTSGSHIGTIEPVLGQDISYYLFRLPWQRTMAGFATLAATTVLAASAVMYGAMGALRWSGKRLWVSDLARTHLATLLAVFALVLYWGYRLAPAEYVAGVRNVPFDSILLDVRIPVARLLSWLALAATGASLLWIRVSRLSLVIAAWSVLMMVSVVGQYVVPTFARYVRAPDELQVEYLERAQREFGSIAYGLPATHDVMTLTQTPEASALSEHLPELAKAPVWDAFAMNVFLNRGPASAPSSQFTRAKIGLYRSPDGDAIPLHLAVRRIDLAEARRTEGDLSWEQVHVEPYAFSSGVFALHAARTSEAGFPLFVPDIAMPDSTSSSVEDLNLDRKEVLFAPGVTEYAVVNGNALARAGVVVEGLWKRVALSWALQSLHIVRSKHVRRGARILWKRDVAERLTALVPFAVFGDPYPVVVDNRLLWMVNGYVYSDESPLAPRVQWIGRSTGYVRAGLVGVVDAWSGEASVILSPWADPLTRTWAEVLPGLVQPAESLPAEVSAHLVYPSEMFELQVGVLEAASETASSGGRRLLGGGTRGSQMRRAAVYWWFGAGPTDSVPSLRLRAALEDGNPPFLSAFAEAWVHRGVPRIEVFRPDDAMTIPGPSQIETRLSGARLSPAGMAGPVRAAPLGDGMLFFQASYDESGADRVPKLADAVVGWGQVVERGNGLTDAVRRVLRSPVERGRASANWVEARRWFERLDDARRRGDWTAFGQAYQNLKRLLTSDGDSVP